MTPTNNRIIANMKNLSPIHFLISRTNIQINQNPQVRKTMKMSQMKLKNP